MLYVRIHMQQEEKKTAYVCGETPQRRYKSINYCLRKVKKYKKIF